MNPLCTGDVREARLNICKQCEYLSNKICTKCGCLMDVKSWISNAKCPEAKW